MKLKALECQLQEVEVFQRPKIQLEQYTTTPHLSSVILHTIQSRYGDIENKSVADLGSGCGILSIGASLLGAAISIGFEIDPEAVDIFQRNKEYFEIENSDVILCDVTKGISPKWYDFFDVVLMNPPFGTRNAGVDVEFLQTGLKMSPIVYSMHKTSTRDYFVKKSKSWGVQCEVVAQLKFDLPPTYKFHSKKSVDIDVDIIRFSKTQ